MPRHVNPVKSDRTSTAPYNFVPLPEKVLAVDIGILVDGTRIKPWERHDEYVHGTFSGWIDLELQTLTPLYIRAARRRDGEWDDRQSRLRPEPYAAIDGRPVIPGSSLRGAMRTLVEILSFAKIRPVSRARPFFRDISPSRISTEYRQYFVDDLGSIHSGIDIETDDRVTRTANGYSARVRAGFVKGREIRECGVARVESRLIVDELGEQTHTGTGPMAMPNPKLQYLNVYIDADAAANDYFFCRKTTDAGKMHHPHLYLRFRKVRDLSASAAAGLQAATLVITGRAPNKHLEFAFLDEPGADSIHIPASIWDRFHDDDQMTQWQQGAFSRDLPKNSGRRRPGYMRDGEPVFFLTDDLSKSDENPAGLVFLGRAQMFRLPYDLSPEQLVPAHLRDAPLDLAEAVFGRAGNVTGMDREAIKGRLFFEDAIATGNGPWTEEVIVPRVLSAPKPTTFQHYLTQDGSQDGKNLKTYLKGDRTAIRGHKLYWHRWEASSGIGQVRETEGQANLLQDLQTPEPHDTQHTVIQPIKTGVSFTGRVRFENLTEIEVGALLSALQLPEDCAHKLGMGKSLGLGSVRITARLRLVDRPNRYASWGACGIVDDDGVRFRDAFTMTVQKHADDSREPLVTGADGLRRIARLDALFLMLQWRNRPSGARTTAMPLANFRARPVLPTPHTVAGHSEPPWTADIPRPGAPSAPSIPHGSITPAVKPMPAKPAAGATDSASDWEQLTVVYLKRLGQAHLVELPDGKKVRVERGTAPHPLPTSGATTQVYRQRSGSRECRWQPPPSGSR